LVEWHEIDWNSERNRSRGRSNAAVKEAVLKEATCKCMHHVTIHCALFNYRAKLADSCGHTVLASAEPQLTQFQV
jgi:hypothetical protein